MHTLLGDDGLASLTETIRWYSVLIRVEPSTGAPRPDQRASGASGSLPGDRGLRALTPTCLLCAALRRAPAARLTFTLRSAHPSTGAMVEIYRVQLPGDPIVGEGKPENQNHAIIFSRGEALQTLDMNQARAARLHAVAACGGSCRPRCACANSTAHPPVASPALSPHTLTHTHTPSHSLPTQTTNHTTKQLKHEQAGYLEEAFKMRNLLMEFGANSDATRPCTLVGFREHIFTAGLTSLATFMGLQEGTQAALAESGAPPHALP